jgi:hypothetical protein
MSIALRIRGRRMIKKVELPFQFTVPAPIPVIAYFNKAVIYVVVLGRRA